MARPSKYNPETVEKIVTAIAMTGSDEAGWTAGNISKQTFYVWLDQFIEFSDAVRAARSEYRDTCPETLVRQANRAFADYLFGRMEKVIVTTERGSREIQGQSVGFEIEKIQRVPVGIPKWAIERVIGKPLDILEAVKTLVEAGVLPRWVIERVSDEVGSARQGIRDVFAGVTPDTGDRAAKPGLSPELAAAIRAHILGIEPTSNAALPETVDSRPQPDQGSREIATGGAELG